jgi:hypothetical protein
MNKPGALHRYDHHQPAEDADEAGTGSVHSRNSKKASVRKQGEVGGSKGMSQWSRQGCSQIVVHRLLGIPRTVRGHL